MRRLDLESVAWLLSGKRVVRLRARDFDMSIDRYILHVQDTADACGVRVALRPISEPPGVVVQAFLPGDSPPNLRVPLIATSKEDTPFLFCPEPGCTNRTADTMPPRGPCELHSKGRK